MVYLAIGLGTLIAMSSFAGHMVGLVVFVHTHPDAGYMSPASSLPLIIAGAAAWQAAGRRSWVREWRAQAPGIYLFVQAAGLLAMFLVVGGVGAGGLMLEGHYKLATMIILVLAPFGAAWLYWRIVPMVERIQQAETDLRAVSRQQELLLNHAGQGIYGLDRAGRITFANPVAAALLGYDANELIGHPMHPLLHARRRDGSSYPEADCPIHTTLQDGANRHVENEVFWHRGGHALEVEYDVAALREGECIAGAVVLFSDVGERLRLLEDLKRWKMVFQHANWGMAIGDADSAILALVNPAFAHMHGYSVEELQGRPIADILAPTVRPSLPDQFRQIHAQNHLRFESLNVRKDGQVFNVLVDVTVVRNESGRVLYHVVNVLDITEQVAREDQLRRSETSLAQAQTQANLGSWWLDIPNNLLEWSDENYRIFGVPIGTTPLTYETFLTCVHPDDRAYVDEQWRAGMAGEPYDIQHRLLVEGQVKWVRERAVLEFHVDGTLWRGVGTTQDITDSKLKEEALLYSRQMLRELAAHHEKIREAERSRIAREIHDELGQYLTALRMDAAVLGIRFGTRDPELDLLARSMKRTIDTTIGVVRDVTAALRPGALDMGLVSATEWLLTGFEERTGILCHLEAPPDIQGLDDARTTAAFRILQESLTNIARHAQAHEVHVMLSRIDHELLMRIVDDGIGFDFDSVARRKTFGLMGIRERALMFGGHVRIDSHPGAGTSLNVTIPLERGAVPAAPAI